MVVLATVAVKDAVGVMVIVVMVNAVTVADVRPEVMFVVIPVPVIGVS